jgi:hypothetical protein
LNLAISDVQRRPDQIARFQDEAVNTEALRGTASFKEFVMGSVTAVKGTGTVVVTTGVGGIS